MIGMPFGSPRDVPSFGLLNPWLPAALFRRRRHVVTEDMRAPTAAEALPRAIGDGWDG